MSAAGWVIAAYVLGAAVILGYAGKIWVGARRLDRVQAQRRTRT